MAPKSVLAALPSDAATCTPDRLSMSVSSALASLVFMLPPMAASKPPARPPTRPPSDAEAPPALLFWNTISGDRP